MPDENKNGLGEDPLERLKNLLLIIFEYFLSYAGIFIILSGLGFVIIILLISLFFNLFGLG